MDDQFVVLGEDENLVGNVRIVPGAPKGMLAWLIKKKIAKNGKGAEQLLFAVFIVCIVLSIAIFFFFGVNHPIIRTGPEFRVGPYGNLEPV